MDLHPVVMVTCQQTSLVSNGGSKHCTSVYNGKLDCATDSIKIFYNDILFKFDLFAGFSGIYCKGGISGDKST